MININFPLKKKDFSIFKELDINATVSITGELITMRDKASEFLTKRPLKNFKKLFRYAAIYHCGPIIENSKVISAGPTTSNRMEIFIEKLLRYYKIRAIIGKGGFSNYLTAILNKNNCIYLQTFGGCGALLSNHIEKVLNVYKLKEFGMVDAIYLLKVKRFPAIVTIANKKNLHEKIIKDSSKRLNTIFQLL